MIFSQLETCRLKKALLAPALLAGMLAGCAGIPKVPEDPLAGFSTEAKPAQNALLNESIKRKTAAEQAWPELTAMPADRPEQLRKSEQARLIADLESARDKLWRDLEQQSTKADRDRSLTVKIIDNGRRLNTDLEEAAGRLLALSRRDRAEARKQSREKMPELGGRTPKTQR